MATDPAQLVRPSPQPAAAGPPRDRLRLRFRKADALRLVSHHDLMQVFERMLRRAAIPFRSTEGFNPKPRMVFALSLALGIVGRQEVVEVELDRPMPPEEVRDRLARQAPPGLEILSARPIERKAAAQPRRVCYALQLPPERLPELPERIAALLAAPACWVDRTRPQPRRLDLRPHLKDVRLEGDALEMDFWVTPGGTARPEEVLALLGLADLLDDGAVLERTVLELHDEVASAAPAPPAAGASERHEPAQAQPAPPRTPRPESLIDGPFSFDS